MSESGIDLDINNYSIMDIEKFFCFKKDEKYTAIQVERREAEMREQLLSSGHIDKRFKRDLIDFLTTAKEWLIYARCKKIDKPTTIPEKLDNLDSLHTTEHTARELNIIKRPETEFKYINSSEYFQGSLNPLNTRIITKCINIDTRFRDNFYTTTSSDFMIKFPEKLSRVVSMQMTALELPICFYGISSSYGNNYLKIDVSFNPSLIPTNAPITVPNTPIINIEKSIIIPDGNYTSNELLDAINNALGPLDAAENFIDITNPFNYVRFKQNITNTGTGHGSISAYIDKTTTNGAIYGIAITGLTLDFASDSNGNTNTHPYQFKTIRLGWNLGFQKPEYYGSLMYTSETVVEPFNMRYIYLSIEDFNHSVNNLFMNAFSNIIIDPNVLARISLRSNVFEIIMDNNLNVITEPRKYFGPVDIQRLRIRIYDDHGRILDMHHSDFSFCLVFKILYDL